MHLSVDALREIAADFGDADGIQMLRLRLRFGTPRSVVAGVRFRIIVELVDEMAQPPGAAIAGKLLQLLGQMEPFLVLSDDEASCASLSYDLFPSASPGVQWKVDCVLSSPSPLLEQVRIQFQCAPSGAGMKLSPSQMTLQSFCTGSQWCDVGSGTQVLVVPVISDLIQVQTTARLVSLSTPSTRCLRVFHVHINGSLPATVHIEEDYGRAMGSHVWDASIWLSVALLRSIDGSVTSDLQTLELGSGCGLFAVVCAKALASIRSPEQRVSQLIVTDKADNIEALHANLDRNGVSSSDATAIPLQWGESLSSKTNADMPGPVGAVFAADVLYHWSAHEQLLTTLAEITQASSPSVYLLHKHRGVETSSHLNTVVASGNDGACAMADRCQWHQWRVERLARVANMDFLRLTRSDTVPSGDTE